MGYARAQVELHRDSLIPEDLTINTWHFRTPSDVASAGSAIKDNLDAFYDAIQTYLSVNLSGSADVKIYDLEDPEPRTPAYESGFTFTPSSTGWPAEVAICLSFQGAVVSGFNQARRRGRVFLGPLSSGASTSSTADQVVSSTARGVITTAATALMSDTTLPGLIWSVFSPSTAGPAPWDASVLSEAFVTVTNGWVDNAFDIIRSRGAAATARSLF